MNTEVTIASTPSSLAGWVAPELAERREVGARRLAGELAALEAQRAVDAVERRRRSDILAAAAGEYSEQVVTVTAGDHVGRRQLSPVRAEQLRADVLELFSVVFTNGWLDGSWTDEDTGEVVAERSLVVVGVTLLPRPVLCELLASVAGQYEQQALGLLVAHGGGTDSLVHPTAS